MMATLQAFKKMVNNLRVKSKKNNFSNCQMPNTGEALDCAKLISESGSKNCVKILKGGYELFSKHYPFLRTQRVIYMPRVYIYF